MLINKWLITATVDQYNSGKDLAGICFYLPAGPTDAGSLYRFVQSLPVEKPFVLLLSGEDFDKNEDYDSYAGKLVGLFFQPSYFLINYQPLIFLQDKTPAVLDFLDKLNEKCRKQGIRDFLIEELNDNTIEMPGKFVYLVNDAAFDFSARVKRWINENIEGNNPSGIHLLIPADKKEIINKVLELENSILETADYKVASAFYQKQQFIEESKHQLYLKTINEKNIRFYLNIQKEERAKGLKWYYYEYEILPIWYKQFGHIIKVLMGKRSFRSLFNNNVKKYKD